MSALLILGACLVVCGFFFPCAHPCGCELHSHNFVACFLLCSRKTDRPLLVSRLLVHSLSWNGIGADGAAAIAEALKSNSTLQQLE